jgi:hypothetical protein
VQILKLLFTPMVFAMGFLVPLFSQSLTAAGVQIDGVSNLVLGGGTALLVGLIAQLRGGWLWHRQEPGERIA